MRRLRAFVRLSRLKFLAGSLVGGALGAAVALYERGGLTWPPLLVAQATLLVFHLMTHYANDYFDQAGDALALRTPFSGGSGVLIDGSLAPRIGLWAALACGLLGLAGTALLALQGCLVTAALALIVGALAWAYSAPPFRLLARGLGEVDGAVVVAILVPLCVYSSQGGPFTPLALAMTLPGAAAMVAMMLAVEFPDVSADEASGKRNLLVRLGTRGVLPIIYGACLAIYLGVALAVHAGAPVAFALLELLTVPLAWRLASAASTRSGQLGRDAAIAGRGVSLFFVVNLFAVFAMLAGLVYI